MMIRGVEEHDLRAALDVANYAYKGNLSFKNPIPYRGAKIEAGRYSSASRMLRLRVAGASRSYHGGV